MPDLDVLEFYPAPGWGASFRMLRGRAEPADVAKAVTHSLARSLRTHGGIPGLRPMATMLGEFTPGESNIAEILGGLRERSRVLGSLHASIAERASTRVLLANSHAGTQVADPERALAAEFLRELSNYHLFSRARPGAVGQLYETETEFHSMERDCMAALEEPIARMVEGLLRDPSGRMLRAPRCKGSRTPTAVLLNTRLT